MKFLIFVISIFFNIIQVEAQSTASVEGNIDDLTMREFHMTIGKKMVNITGKEVMGMAINNTIPGRAIGNNEYFDITGYAMRVYSLLVRTEWKTQSFKVIKY